MGLEGTAYIYPDGAPQDALYFPLYPDKQSLSGGTVVGRKGIPGFAREVITPLSRKSVDQKISLLFSDRAPPRPGRDAPLPHVQSAYAWLMRHLGPGEEGSPYGDDDENVFVVKLLAAPQKVVVEKWSAELQILKPDREYTGNIVVQMRVDMDLLHYVEFAVDTSVLGALKGRARKKPKKKPKDTGKDARGRNTESSEAFKELYKMLKGPVEALTEAANASVAASSARRENEIRSKLERRGR